MEPVSLGQGFWVGPSTERCFHKLAVLLVGVLVRLVFGVYLGATYFWKLLYNSGAPSAMLHKPKSSGHGG